MQVFLELKLVLFLINHSTNPLRFVSCDNNSCVNFWEQNKTQKVGSIFLQLHPDKLSSCKTDGCWLFMPEVSHVSFTWSNNLNTIPIQYPLVAAAISFYSQQLLMSPAPSLIPMLARKSLAQSVAAVRMAELWFSHGKSDPRPVIIQWNTTKMKIYVAELWGRERRHTASKRKRSHGSPSIWTCLSNDRNMQISSSTHVGFMRLHTDFRDHPVL